MTQTVGPAEHTRAGNIKFAKYGNGETAIIVESERGREAVATVNLEDYGVEAPLGHVWLKGWSENEGLPEALEDAGIVKLTGDTTPAGFVEAQLAELTEASLAAIEDQL